MSVNRLILISIGMFLFLGLFLTPTSSVQVETNEVESFELTQSYTPHDQIIIEHPDNFTQLGLSGDGTKGNPYIIEGLEIISTEH